MLTYVINTSENKTFDCDQLFKLVGYSKICWLNYSLDEIEKCAEEICEKQTALGADDFRLAILIDFYGFDRVRNLYGSDGYTPDEMGVDLSLYFPFIEAYVYDHLFSKIRKKELIIKERHIFYIQNGKHDDFNVVSNIVKQLEYILEPDEDCVTDVISYKVPKEEFLLKRQLENEKALANKDITSDDIEGFKQLYEEKKRLLENVESDSEIEKRSKALIENLQAAEDLKEKELFEPKTETVYIEIPQKRYSKFNLYCTENLSLSFQMSDYPYTNERGLTFEEFYRAFKQRECLNHDIKRHYYYASFGSGIAKAAFDNLSLSLYLIKLYEREESMRDNEEVVIGRIDPETLKSMLITAWNKICSARTIALNNSSEYYDIKSLEADRIVDKKAEQEEMKVKINHQVANDANKLSVDKMYSEICKICVNNDGEMTADDKIELDSMMSKYLIARDDINESSDDVQFNSIKDDIKKVKQCPSKTDYERTIAKKKDRISKILKETMNVEYQNKDYTEQKEQSDKAYTSYLLAKRSLNRALLTDLALWFFMMVVVMVPFIAIKEFNFTSVMMYLSTAVLFTGIFILAFAIAVIPLVKRLKVASKKVKECYIECRSQQKNALIDYQYRYENELRNIEHLRYDLRNITRLHNHNLAKNKNIEQHRQMLEIVENHLSAMLNNLGVEPVIVKYKDLDNEFNVTKSYMSNENRIYKIFSIETIEGLFNGGRGK